MTSLMIAALVFTTAFRQGNPGLAADLTPLAGMLCLCAPQGKQPNSRANEDERDDILQADNAILASLAIAVSARGSALCIHSPVACVGPDRLELALSLIAARNTSASLRALAGLVRYALDGAYAEDYDDIVLRKGKTILPLLLSVSPQALHKKCGKDFAEFVRTSSSALGDVREEHVCSSEESIKQSVSSLLDAIRHNRRPE